MLLLGLTIGIFVVLAATVALAEALMLLVLRVSPRCDEFAEFLEVAGLVLGELTILVTVMDALWTVSMMSSSES